MNPIIMNIHHDLTQFPFHGEIWVSKTLTRFYDYEMIEILYIQKPPCEEDMYHEHVDLTMTIYYETIDSHLLKLHLEKIKNHPLYEPDGIHYGITPKILLQRYERILWDEV